MDAEGGGATGRGRSLFHQTTTTGNTDKTHLLMLWCSRTGGLRRFSRKNKKKTQSATRIDSKGRKRMCFLKMSASSRTGDDGDVVCGGLAICWMLSSCWDCSLILGPELWNNPPPPAAPLSPSPSVCPEDRHPDSTRSHYLPSYIYYHNNNNNESRNMIIMILIATMTNDSCFWFFFRTAWRPFSCQNKKCNKAHNVFFNITQLLFFHYNMLLLLFAPSNIC